MIQPGLSQTFQNDSDHNFKELLIARDSSHNMSMGTPKTEELPDINNDNDPFDCTAVIVQVPPKEAAIGGFDYVPQVDNLVTSGSEEPGFPTKAIINLSGSPQNLRPSSQPKSRDVVGEFSPMAKFQNPIQ